jgi:hypothetical protein
MRARIVRCLLHPLAMLVATAASAALPSEDAVKAAFLPRFARYVEWPDAAVPAGRPLQLCIVGRDPFGPMLERVTAGESVQGRPIEIRRFNLAEHAAACHIAFVSGSERQTPSQMLAALSPRPILTVTDARIGPQRGIIHFVVDGGKVRFFIDNGEASRKGLAISSRLLALAVNVKQRGS